MKYRIYLWIFYGYTYGYYILNANELMTKAPKFSASMCIQSWKLRGFNHALALQK